MSRVVLIRHALTDFDKASTDGRFCGTSDPPLNDRGRDEARNLAQALTGLTVGRIQCSPLLRSRQTADVIASVIGGAVVEVDGRLREIDYGLWDGLTKGEIVERFADAYGAFASDPVSNHPLSGEQPAKCLERARDWLVNAGDALTVAVTHKTWTRLLLCELMGIPLRRYRDALDLKIASVVSLLSSQRGWRLEALNYAATSKRVFGT